MNVCIEKGGLKILKQRKLN